MHFHNSFALFIYHGKCLVISAKARAFKAKAIGQSHKLSAKSKAIDKARQSQNQGQKIGLKAKAKDQHPCLLDAQNSHIALPSWSVDCTTTKQYCFELYLE